MKMLGRVAIWACSLCLSAVAFSLAFSVLVNGNVAVNPFFLVTVKLAFSAWCLYLPLAVLVKNGKGRQKLILLLAGAVVGPATVFAMAIVALARGVGTRSVWQGDPLIGIGAGVGIILAAIVGVVTVAFYLTGLKLCFPPERSGTTKFPGSALEP
jgi:hypothetical protein